MADLLSEERFEAPQRQAHVSNNQETHCGAISTRRPAPREATTAHALSTAQPGGSEMARRGRIEAGRL